MRVLGLHPYTSYKQDWRELESFTNRLMSGMIRFATNLATIQQHAISDKKTPDTQVGQTLVYSTYLSKIVNSRSGIQ